MKNSFLKSHAREIGRIFIAVFSLVITICVAYVMINVYSPNQNALGALSSVCMDVICIIIILIFICSVALNTYSATRTTSLFAALLTATMWALFTDFINWAFDGSLELGKVTFWFTVGSLCMGSVLACIFSLYLYSYMYENHHLKKMHTSARVCAVLNVLSFFLTLGLALSGTAFKFVDGHYELGALYDVVTVIPILTLLYLTGFVFANVKKVGKHDALAAAGYILFMICGALLEAFFGIGTTYVSVTIADLFIFVTLQNEVIALEKRNVQEWMQKSNTDELTGVGNRFAYENDIKGFENVNIPENFVYVSIDVNSLKKVNDTMGHNAGDELLIGAAECLQKCLGPYGKIYRTGGDEFIALINVEEDLMPKIQKDLDDATRKWHGKFVNSINLSCGYVTRGEAKKSSIRQIAVMADKKMYNAKDEFYKRTGIERRKK